MPGLQTRSSLTSLYGRPPLTTGYGPYTSPQAPTQAYPYDPQTEANRQRDVLEKQQGLNLRTGTAQADELDAQRQRDTSLFPDTQALSHNAVRLAQGQPDWNTRQTTERNYQLADEARHREQSLLDEQRHATMLQSLFGSLSGPGGDLPEVSRSGGPVGDAESAAEAAALARAKDKAGLIARGSLTALRSQGGATGRLGSGAESKATQGVLSGAASDLGDINRQQAVTAADRGRQVAGEEYQGRIAQRGQNISRRGQLLAALPSLASLFRMGAAA